MPRALVSVIFVLRVDTLFLKGPNTILNIVGLWAVGLCGKYSAPPVVAQEEAQTTGK